MNPSLVDLEFPQTEFKLQFRLKSWRQGVDNDLQYYQVLTLENHERTCTASIYCDFLKLRKLKAGECLEITVRPAFKRKARHYILNDLRHLTDDDINNGAELLPVGRCPEEAKPALDRLVKLNDHLTHPALRRFVSQALLDPVIGIPMLTCKASQNHHHAYPGGLLVHSIDVAANASRMAADTLSRPESELVAVAALFHDIGKLWTVGQDDERPNLGRFVRHEMLTAAVLARHLERLKQDWSEGVEALFYLWDFQSRHPRNRGYAKFIGADFLVWADQMSASSFHARGLEALHG